MTLLKRSFVLCLCLLLFSPLPTAGAVELTAEEWATLKSSLTQQEQRWTEAQTELTALRSLSDQQAATLASLKNNLASSQKSLTASKQSLEMERRKLEGAQKSLDALKKENQQKQKENQTLKKATVILAALLIWRP